MLTAVSKFVAGGAPIDSPEFMAAIKSVKPSEMYIDEVAHTVGLVGASDEVRRACEARHYPPQEQRATRAWCSVVAHALSQRSNTTRRALSAATTAVKAGA